jgi:hypothetical protein
MRRFRSVTFLAALAMGVFGCATAPRRAATVSLKATGDPGVSVRVRTTIPGVPEQVAQVPAELTFTGERFDLYCVHGPQAGRLSLMVSRGGVSMSTGDTTQPGQVTHFVVGHDSLAVGTPELPKSK